MTMKDLLRTLAVNSRFIMSERTPMSCLIVESFNCLFECVSGVGIVRLLTFDFRLLFICLFELKCVVNVGFVLRLSSFVFRHLSFVICLSSFVFRLFLSHGLYENVVHARDFFHEMRDLAAVYEDRQQVVRARFTNLDA